MNISPVSFANVKRVSFKCNECKKPEIEINATTPDNEIVAYGNWGDNYAYPITAGQIRKGITTQPSTTKETNNKETEQEYYNRKLFSTEWFN